MELSDFSAKHRGAPTEAKTDGVLFVLKNKLVSKKTEFLVEDDYLFKNYNNYNNNHIYNYYYINIYIFIYNI